MPRPFWLGRFGVVNVGDQRAEQGQQRAHHRAAGNTEPAIRELASSVIRTAALCMPLFAFANAAYFTLRSGGKTLITFFFDSCYTWLINFPIAFVLSRYTALPQCYCPTRPF